MTSRKAISLFVTIALILGAAAYWLGHMVASRKADRRAEHMVYEKGYDPDVPAERAVSLQKLATASCQCAQKAGEGDDEGCWREYKAAVRPLEPGGVAEACTPISALYDCIATDKGEKCILTEFSIIGSDDFVCTEDELRRVETVYSSTRKTKMAQLGREDIAAQNEASNAADEAVAEIVERIRRGQTLAVIEYSGGCGG